MTSLLILGKGDTAYTDRNMQRLFTQAQQAGMDVQRCDYSEISTASNFRHARITVMLFFPFTFWNEHCEAPQDTQLYGTSKHAYELFRDYFLTVQADLARRYGGLHQLDYVIQPEFAALDRDKIATIEHLKNNGITTTESIATRDLTAILSEVTPERGVFIKCRYGAEGKGITVLRNNQWRTNYQVVGDKLTNYGTNDRWPFTDITGRRELLHQLLDDEVIVEREILVPNLFVDEKFDIRAYVVGNEVPHFFMRINAADRVVTNFSQGARILHHPQTELDDACIAKIKKLALAAAQGFNSQFLGVDIIFDGSMDEPRVMEVQTFTDFPDPTKFDLVRHFIKVLQK